MAHAVDLRNTPLLICDGKIWDVFEDTSYLVLTDIEIAVHLWYTSVRYFHNMVQYNTILDTKSSNLGRA